MLIGIFFVDFKDIFFHTRPRSTWRPTGARRDKRRCSHQCCCRDKTSGSDPDSIARNRKFRKRRNFLDSNELRRFVNRWNRWRGPDFVRSFLPQLHLSMECHFESCCLCWLVVYFGCCRWCCYCCCRLYCCCCCGSCCYPHCCCHRCCNHSLPQRTLAVDNLVCK